MRLQLGGKKNWRRVVSRSVTFDGKPAHGYCDHATRTIRIEDGQPPKMEMDTDIHEALHAIFPWMRDWMVFNAAGELTELLYDKLGYRRVIT